MEGHAAWCFRRFLCDPSEMADGEPTMPARERLYLRQASEAVISCETVPQAQLCCGFFLLEPVQVFKYLIVAVFNSILAAP